MPIELKVPPAGESITEVEIGQWLKTEGDQVQSGENLVEIETEKVTLELPAPASGTLTKILKRQGEAAKVGEVIGLMEPADVAAGTSSARPAGPAPSKPDAPESATAKSASTSAAEPRPPTLQNRFELPERPAASSRTNAAKSSAAAASPKAPADSPNAPIGQQPSSPSGPIMPAAQRALDEHGLTAADVRPTGPGGRLLKEDVIREAQRRRQTGSNPPAVAQDAAPRAADSAPAPGSPAPTSAPRPSAPPDAEIPPTSPQLQTPNSKPQNAPAPGTSHSDAARSEELHPMTPIRRRIAQRLVEAQQTAALLTTFNEIDMSAVLALRGEYQQSFQDRYKTKLGFMSFFVKAAIEALKAIPAVNAEIRGTDIAYRNYYDIGIAIGGGRGLVVPVLRNAERMSFAEIELAIADFAGRARDKKLTLDDLDGGTFTISNGGIYGSLLSTPIVNPPQSGILGLHAIQDRPVARDNQVVIRPMMYIALTYDHRLIDGREAVTFLKRIKECIEQPSRILLEV